jgi:hypothetical protein
VEHSRSSAVEGWQEGHQKEGKSEEDSLGWRLMVSSAFALHGV